MNHDKITSFKAILNQEFCVEDKNNERYLNNLSIGDLSNKVKKYNTLYLENVRIILFNILQYILENKYFCVENQYA